MQIFKRCWEIQTAKKIGAILAFGFLSTTPLAVSASFGDGSPTIQSPTVFSLHNVMSKVDGQTGAFTQHIPLDIPPGRNGLQPDLALDYNSQNTEDSIVGYGWSLSIPYIQRLNKTGSQDLYGANPYFMSSTDGELATTSTATSSPVVYRARVDDGSFRQYNYNSASSTWTVYDKSGTRYQYGATSQSQQSATTSPTRIYKWMLEEIRDTNDNYVKFVYLKEGNQIYPYQIIYTGNGATDGPATILLATSTRSDPYISYKSGFRVLTNYRISHITASFNASTVREYALSYTAGANGYRSLLSSVQETGTNDTGQQVTLPAMTFGYASATTTAFYTKGSAAGPAYPAADINGNGMNDVTEFYKNIYNGQLGSYIIPDGQAGFSSITPPEYWAENQTPTLPIETGARFLDVNADGKADLLSGIRGTATTSTLYLNTYATSTGYGWTATTTYSGVIPPFMSTSTTAYQSTGIFGDVNGDGLPDYAMAQPGAGFAGTATYLGNGSAWNAATTTIFVPYASFPTTAPTGYNSQLIDINGDGLADWMISDTANTYFIPNTGMGWSDVDTDYTQFNIGTTTLYAASVGATYYDRGIRFFDINGDGLPDMIHSYRPPSYTSSSAPLPEKGTYNDVFLNTGHGWATSTAYSLSGYITSGTTLNGDWQGKFNYDEYYNLTGNGQQQQDVISTVRNPKGGSTSVTYALTTQTLLHPSLPYSLLTVSSLINHDGRGSNEETDYSYQGGLQYLPSSVFDRKFAGFATSTETRSDKKITTYFNQGLLVQTALGEQSEGYAQINHPFRIDVFTPSNTLLQKTFNRWDTVAHGASTFVGLGRQVVQKYAADGTHRDSATEYLYSSTTDDVIGIDQYGEVTGNSDGTFTDIGSDSRQTSLTYAASSSVNMSVLIEKHVYDGLSTSTSPGAASVSALVVGGGGGGAWGGGGGGAGGLISDTAFNVTAQAYSITVGAGGAGGTNGARVGANGSDSVFSTNTAVGGGGGGTDSGNGSNGGSGGGGEYNAAGVGGTATSGQGNNGGNGAVAGGGWALAGGGGGAAAAGVNANSGSQNSGDGGAGTANSISGASVTYAGGGGGGIDTRASGSAGTGGSGGGGNGSKSTTGGNGTANTGDGGGGGKYASGSDGGSGGSGVVIISYPTGSLTATGGAITTSGGNTVHTFTSSGTWTVTSITATSSTTGATVSDDTYLYDGLPFGQVTAGNQTTQQNWISGTTYASSTKTYNSYGLPTQSTDRRGKSTTYAYDPFNLYVATTTNALSQATGATYNYSNGKIKQTNDPNGRLLKNIYDGVGRLTEVDQSDVTTPTTFVTKTTYQYTDSTSTPSLVHESDYLNAATTTDAHSYYDGFNRLVQQRKSSENSGTSTVSDFIYNSAGLLASQSLPYFSTGTSLTSTTTTSALYSNLYYDALGRVATTTNAVGTTTKTYITWTTRVADALGNTKDYIADAYGNLAKVVERAPAVATTTYGYDAANNLTSITDAVGNVRNFTYDGLGRRLTAQDLHTTGSSYGTTTYAYDDAGNTTSQTDPKSQTLTRTYDDLNRLLTESTSTVANTLTYDSCTNGIGFLCTASSTDAKISYAYDILGRTKIATTTINGTNYTNTSAYDRLGNPTSITYPDGSQVQYTYNTANRLSGIQQKPSGGSFVNVVSGITYAPTSDPTTLQYGNGLTGTNAYDSSALYRLTSKTTCLVSCSATTTTLQSLAFTYDAVGNILTRTDNSYLGLGQQITYAYDQLNRLLSASIADSSASTTITTNTSTTAAVTLNDVAGDSDDAQGFTTTQAGTIGTGTFYLTKIGSPTGDIVVHLQADDGTNHPTGTDLASTTLSNASLLSGIPKTVTWNFSSPVSVLNNTKYWIRFSDTVAQEGGYNGTTGFQLAGNTTYGYSGGNANRWNGSAWDNSINNYDLTMTVRIDSGISTVLSALDPYTQTFSYDALGNITSGAAGVYTYGGTGTPNPDAPTRLVLTTGASTPTIAFDNSTLAGSGTNSSSLTFSHLTNSSTNGLILVAVQEATTTPCTADTVTGVTYNGVSLTDLGYYVRNSTTVGGAMKTYYGFAPAQATHNVVISSSASCIRYATATTYTGVKQSGMPNASGTGNPLSDSGAVSLFQATTTTSGTNAWAILAGVPSIAGSVTAGPNTTLRGQQSGNLYYADSGGPISSPSATGLSWSIASSSTTITNTGTTAAVTLNDVPGDGDDAQGFTTTQAGTISTGTFYLTKFGSPTGDIVVHLQADDGTNHPSGTDLGSVQLSNASLMSGIPKTVTWTFASPVAVTNNTKYWIRFSDTVAQEGGYNGTTGFQLAGNTTYGYSGGNANRWNGSAWDNSINNYDLTMTVQIASSSSANWLANYFSIAPTVSTPGSVSITTYSYDANGNLTTASNSATSTFYTYDYANRLIKTDVGGGGATTTTTYGYDYAGNRVFQTTASTTTLYPSKFYSILSTTVGATTTATTTRYLFGGDALFATIDGNGSATTTSYIHPDNLGSTNVVTNASGTTVQALDYYPYGATRYNNGSTTNELRQYIGQFTDSTGLDYLNARYYEGSRGQFLTEDPVFWEIGQTKDGINALANPQAMNSYGYANDNPITNKDPAGRCPTCALALIGAGAGMAGQYGYDVYNNIQSNGFSAEAFYSNLSSPQTYLTRAIQGGVIGLTGGAAGTLTGVGLVGQAAIVGGVSGVVGAGGNAALGDPITAQSVVADTVIGGLTFGLGAMVPKVPGRLPNFGSNAFFAGKHTQQSALQLGYGAISNYVGQLFAGSGSTPQTRSAAVQSFNSSSGASAPQSRLWVTPSGAVVDWGGAIVAGPAPASTPSTSKRRVRKKRKTETKEEVTVYKPLLSVMGGGLVILPILFFGLTLPLIIEGAPVPPGRLLGLGGLWLTGIAVTFLPLAFRLEVGNDHVETYFFGFRIKELLASDVERIEYDNIRAWGLSVGKGIKVWKRGTGRFFSKPKWAFDASIGESVYGKEAIAHARRVLSSDNELSHTA